MQVIRRYIDLSMQKLCLCTAPEKGFWNRTCESNETQHHGRSSFTVESRGPVVIKVLRTGLTSAAEFFKIRQKFDGFDRSE
jgi:hypothetical protein